GRSRSLSRAALDPGAHGAGAQPALATKGAPVRRPLSRARAQDAARGPKRARLRTPQRAQARRRGGPPVAQPLARPVLVGRLLRWLEERLDVAQRARRIRRRPPSNVAATDRLEASAAPGARRGPGVAPSHPPS